MANATADQAQTAHAAAEATSPQPTPHAEGAPQNTPAAHAPEHTPNPGAA